MSQTSNPSSKQFSDFDQNQIFKKSYNDVGSTISVDGWLVGQVGRKIVKASPSSTVDTFSFYEGTNLMFQYTITYTDNTKSDFTTVERTA